MALVTHKFKLDLTPGAARQVLYTSQGDIGRPFEANLYWNGSPWTATGTTANIRGKKPDDTVFDYTATVSGSSVTFSTTEQMTIISGPVECELVFSNDGDVIASANFVLIVEASPYNPEALSESDVDTLGELVSDQIPPAVGEWLEDNVSVAPTKTVIDNAVSDYIDENGIDLSDYALQSELDKVKAVTVTETETTTTENILNTLTYTSGYMGVNGATGSASTLQYSEKIPVSEGDTLGTVGQSGFRFITAFNGDTAVSDKGTQNVASYTVPADIDGVVITIYTEAGRYTEINHTYTTTAYTNILDNDVAELQEKQTAIERVVVTEDYTDLENIPTVPSFTTGAIAQTGVVFPDYTSFQYTQKIPVQENDVVTATSNGTTKPLRWVCAYNGEIVTDKGNASDHNEYTVPSGVDYVVVTVRITDNVDTINVLRNTEKLSAYVKPIPMGYMSGKGTLSNGDSLTLPYHNVKINNCYIFNANITSFSSFTFQKQSNTTITVDEQNITIVNDQRTEVIPHGLTIGHNITLLVENNTTTYTSLIRLASDGTVFDYTTAVRFLMDEGTPRVTSNGSVLTECTFSWVSKNINCPIWLFGDSYFSWYASRWVYYLVQDGYDKTCMLNGYAGQASNTAYNALANLLKVTTPKIVVWCLGMNNGDTSDAVSTSWKYYYDLIVELQKKYGFELVLYTTPTTPTINNNYKNAIVRSSGYRYIEADKAVRINDNGEWVSGALDVDNVHPTAIGAKILYNRFLSDLPELMCNR